jgi:hypothetical protein
VAETPTAEFAILHSGRSTPPGVESASSSAIFSHRAAYGQQQSSVILSDLPASRHPRTYRTNLMHLVRRAIEAAS